MRVQHRLLHRLHRRCGILALFNLMPRHRPPTLRRGVHALEPFWVHPIARGQFVFLHVVVFARRAGPLPIAAGFAGAASIARGAESATELAGLGGGPIAVVAVAIVFVAAVAAGSGSGTCRACHA